MKRSKTIKLLSLLLCAVLLLASCGEEPVETPPPEAPEANQPVAPEFKSYFDVEYESSAISFNEATRFDGEVADTLVYNDVTLLLLKKSRIDHMNRVCEQFRVYNVEVGEILSPIDNSFDRVGVIPENNYITEDEKQKYTVSVDFEVFGTPGNEIPLVEVRVTELEKISEEEKEADKNVTGEYRTISDKYSYYDVFGTEVISCSTNMEALSPVVTKFAKSIRVDIGKFTAVFDNDDYRLIETFNNELETVFADYVDINDKYYYFANSSILGGYVKVYDRTGIEVYSKSVQDNFNIFVLDNGNFIYQYFTFVIGEENQGDVLIGDSWYDLHTYHVDMSTKKETEIKTNYIISMLLTTDDFENYNIPVTDHTKNIVIFDEIEKHQYSSEKRGICVVDDDFKVLFEVEDRYPIETTPLVFESIAPGYFKLGLFTVADYVIIDSEGRAMSVINADLAVTENALVSELGIYDYSLRSIYDFESYGQEFVAVVDNSIVVVNAPDPEKAEYERVYEMITVDANGDYIKKKIFSREYVLEAVHGDVIEMKNTETGKYTIFNNKCEHLLTTHTSFKIIENGGRYVVKTYADGRELAYTLG